MTIYSLGPNTIQRLVDQPESGIGYQIVRYRNDPIVIFNATAAIPLKELRESRFHSEDLDALSDNPEATGNHEHLDLNDEAVVVFSLLDQNLRKDDFGLSFSEAVVEPSDKIIPSGVPRSYYRYSSYYKDKRIMPNGDFLPGTYATTYSDMHFVPSGFAAVGRYALPNPASACYLFTLVTFDRPTLMGTATPNFSQAGGGVEVLFGNGAKNKPGASFKINIG